MNSEKVNPEQEGILDVKFIKLSEPILIDNEQKKGKYNGYPPGYNKVFDYIYPPVEWTEDGKKWRQVASTERAGRHEMLALAEDLKSNLSFWHASTIGVCPVRRELYSQCFIELIRQVCVNSIDRGELLIKIRDEYNASIKAHKDLYENGLMLKIKHSASDDSKNNMSEKDFNDIENQNSILKKKVADAKIQYNRLKNHLEKELNNLRDAHQHELNFFNRNNKALKDQLSIILARN